MFALRPQPDTIELLQDQTVFCTQTMRQRCDTRCVHADLSIIFICNWHWRQRRTILPSKQAFTSPATSMPDSHAQNKWPLITQTSPGLPWSADTLRAEQQRNSSQIDLRDHNSLCMQTSTERSDHLFLRNMPSITD